MDFLFCSVSSVPAQLKRTGYSRGLYHNSPSSCSFHSTWARKKIYMSRKNYDVFHTMCLARPVLVTALRGEVVGARCDRMIDGIAAG